MLPPRGHDICICKYCMYLCVYICVCVCVCVQAAGCYGVIFLCRFRPFSSLRGAPRLSLMLEPTAMSVQTCKTYRLH